jgi:hypothetical protein
MVTNRIVKSVAGKAIAKHGVGRFVDFGLGLALMRDARVPMRAKAMAMGVGIASMTALVALEVPLEGMLAMLLPLLGPAVDLAIDGAEETIGSLLVATLVIQKLAPKDVVEQIREERS